MDWMTIKKFESQAKGRGVGPFATALAMLFLVRVSCGGLCTHRTNELLEHILPHLDPIHSGEEEKLYEDATNSTARAVVGNSQSSSMVMSYCDLPEHSHHLFHLQKFGLVSINSSEPSAQVVSVDDFGAKGDGKTDDTEAFEKAWREACSSVLSKFVVPPGKNYVVKPITFSGPCKSGFIVQISGTIVAPEDPAVWEGLNSRLWLRFLEVDDLTVEGGGTINGSGQIWWARSCKVNKQNPCRSAPTALTFESMGNLRVRDLSVENSQQMHISLEKCVGVRAENLRISSPGSSPNTDGIHVTGSKYVDITNSIIAAGDDCISIVSGSIDIRAQNITCGPGHGISIGSLGNGHSEALVSGIMVDGVSLHGTTNGLRIKTWQGGSGFARGIAFQNVQMDNVSNPIIIDQYYCDSEKPCPKQASAVKVSNVSYKHIRGTTPTKVAVKFACSDSVPCEGIALQDILLTSIHSETTLISYCEDAKGSSSGTTIPPPCF